MAEIIEPFSDQLSHFSIFSEQITLQSVNMFSYFHLMGGEGVLFKMRDVVWGRGVDDVPKEVNPAYELFPHPVEASVQALLQPFNLCQSSFNIPTCL